MAFAAVAAVGVMAVVLERRRRRRDAVFAAGHSPPERPRELDMAVLGLAPPAPGRLLAVLFSDAHCAGCEALRGRLGRLDRVDVVDFDASVDPEPLRVAGIDRVPILYLCDQEGATVRSWTGAPLPGTIEETVMRTLSG